MKLVLTLIPLLAVSTSSLAAPMSTNPEASTSQSAPSQPAAPQQAQPAPALPQSPRPAMNEDWSGHIFGVSDSVATEGPPHFTGISLPDPPASMTKTKARTNFRKNQLRAHPFVVTHDHDAHVEGVHITAGTEAGQTPLEKLPAEYGIQTSKPGVKLVMPTVFAAKQGLPDPPKDFPQPQKLTQENLEKLRKDTSGTSGNSSPCKRGLDGAACSFRQVHKVANRKATVSPSTPARPGIAKGKSATRQTQTRKAAIRRPFAPTAKHNVVKKIRPPFKSGSPAVRRKNAIAPPTSKMAVKSVPRKTRK